VLGGARSARGAFAFPEGFVAFPGRRWWLTTPGLTQIFRLDVASTKRDMALAGGSVATTERFHRLAWSPSGVETGELPVRAATSLAASCQRTGGLRALSASSRRTCSWA
jgi:hypothetical protein